MPILYTISAAGMGTPLGDVAGPLKRRESEPILYPDAFDKFLGGELKKAFGPAQLPHAGPRRLGDKFRRALYRNHGGADLQYDVVIPLDGVNAKRNYEHEYAIHQMTILPASAYKQFRFTNWGWWSLSELDLESGSSSV